MRLFRAFPAVVTATALTAGALASVPSAEAQLRIEVAQGMQIETPEGVCTLGFNDHARGVSYTAAHCGKEGQRVSVVDAHGRKWKNVGTISPSKRYANLATNDWATIRWDTSVSMQRNAISGDKMVDPATVRKGEKACFNGRTSHGNTYDSTCGEVVGVAGNTVVTTVTTRAGDSGGPVFIPGRGLVGVTAAGTGSGDQAIAMLGKPLPSGYACAPKDGPTVTGSDLSRIFSSYYKMPIIIPGFVLGGDGSDADVPNPVLPAPGENGGLTGTSVSPQLKTGIIVALILSLVLSAVPFLLQFVSF